MNFSSINKISLTFFMHHMLLWHDHWCWLKNANNTIQKKQAKCADLAAQTFDSLSHFQVLIKEELSKKMDKCMCNQIKNTTLPSRSVYRPSFSSLCLSFFSSPSVHSVPVNMLNVFPAQQSHPSQPSQMLCVDSNKRASTAQSLAAQVNLGCTVQLNKYMVCQQG